MYLTCTLGCQPRDELQHLFFFYLLQKSYSLNRSFIILDVASSCFTKGGFTLDSPLIRKHGPFDFKPFSEDVGKLFEIRISDIRIPLSVATPSSEENTEEEILTAAANSDEGLTSPLLERNHPKQPAPTPSQKACCCLL